MIPYWKLTHLRAGPISISTPILLAAIGIMVAHFLLLRRAGSKGLNVETAAMMSLIMVLAGLAGAYWFRGVYLADAVKQDWRTLLAMQPGAASFGGIAGGLLAGWAYLAARGIAGADILRYFDALAYVFPQGWVFGRIGCSLVHDHPGVRSASWLAVRFPGGAQFDLAVLEVLFFALGIIPLFVLLDRPKRRGGFWLGLLLTLYGAFRLWLDTLHVDPPRYGWFTVDQWAYGSALIAGLLVLFRTRPDARSSATKVE